MTPEIFAAGGVMLDCVVEADGTVHVDRIGGNAVHAAAGARLFTASAGIVGLVPASFPDLAAIAAAGLDVEGIRRVPGAHAQAEWFFNRADGAREDRLHADAAEYRAFADGAGHLSDDARARWIAHLRASAAERTGFAEFRAAHPVRTDDVPATYWRARGAHLGANEPAATLALARAAKAHGLVVTLDPGFRAAAYDAAYLDAVLDTVDAFLPSEKELDSLRPGVPHAAALAELAGRGRANVVLKRGAAGAWVIGQDGVRLEAPALPARARDPVGAGDAFCGGFLSALAVGAGLEAAMRRGVVAGACAVEVSGADALARVDTTTRDLRLSQTSVRIGTS